MLRGKSLRWGKTMIMRAFSLLLRQTVRNMAMMSCEVRGPENFLCHSFLLKSRKKIIQSKLNQSKTLFAKCWNWLHTLWSPLQSRLWIDDCASQKIGSRTNFQTNFSPHNSLSQFWQQISHCAGFLKHAHGTKNKCLASVFHAWCYSSDSFVTRLRVKVIHQACRRPMHTTNNNNHATGSPTHYPN